MANALKNYIPNAVTCLNLFSGCIASVMAFEARYDLALTFIILSAVFDFFDGMLARTLNAHSPIGKDLDSWPMILVLCGTLIRYLFIIKRNALSGKHRSDCPLSAICSFSYLCFSGLRLAKFNNDTRQTSSFIGLPVPANALFWGALIYGAHDFLVSESCHPVYILLLVMLFSWLLVSEIPMFSLKFKSLSWKDNKISFIFLIVCIPLLIFLGVSGFAAIILWYIILSLFTRKNR